MPFGSVVDSHPNPMRILLQSLNFYPELTGVGKYSGEMAFWLADRGHDVRVVAGHPYFPEWKVAEPYRAFEIRRERVRGVEIVRVPLWVPRSPGGLTRALHLASFSISCAPAVLSFRSWNPQAVVAVVPTLAAAPWVLGVARRTRAVPWIHFQDLEVDAGVDLDLVRWGWLSEALMSFEARLLRKFARVSTLSEEMSARLRAKGVSHERIFSLPNWVDPEAVKPGDRSTALRRELDIHADHRVVLYSGSVGRKQGLEILIELARRFESSSDVRFLIAGEGPGLGSLKELAVGLGNVRFLPLQPSHRLNELLSSADVHFLSQLPAAEELVLPSKVIGMLASGRPILAAAGPRSTLGRIVTEAGLVRANDDLEGLVTDLRRLLSDPAFASECGAAGRRIAMTRFDRDDILGRFEAELVRLAGGGSVSGGPGGRNHVHSLPLGTS